MTHDRDGEVPCPKCKRFADSPDIRSWGRCPQCRITELEAIVEKLPRTADGVPVVPGMTLWFVETRDTGKTWFVNEHEPIRLATNHYWISDKGYSTRAAAEAEAGKEGATK